MSDAPLGPNEIVRYGRHIVMPEIGGAGQQALKRARVAVIGAGGLGAPVLTYLAAAGIGELTIIDDDEVSLSNLQRQTIFSVDDVGRPKTEAAARFIKRLNPHVVAKPLSDRLSQANAAGLLSGHDVIIDGSDNFPTRYLSAETAEALHTTLVTGAIMRFDGSVTTLAPFDKDDTGKPLPRYLDLFPVPPAEGTVPSCAEAGVLGALAGMVGSIMATEAIKVITGAGQPLYGTLMLIDALGMRMERLDYGRSVDQQAS